jgi:hypothetical protein
MSKDAAPMPDPVHQQAPPPYNAAATPSYAAPPYGAPPPAYNPFEGQANTMNGQQVYYGAPTVAQPHPQAAPVYYQGPSPYSQPVPGGQPVYYANGVPAYGPPRPQRVAGGAACVKCGTTYPLPDGASSWRCKTCSQMNNINGDQCVVM